MYIYFDVDGNLKEVIQEPVREGSIAHNRVYVYVESGNPEPVSGVYHLPSAYPNAKADFKLLDTNQNLNPNGGNSVAFTKINNVEIPLNQNRDLYFFKYGYKYEMFYMELSETVTEVDGVVSMTAKIYNVGSQRALNTYNFNVESSVGVTLDSTMTQAQYNYLYNHMVPYNDNYVNFSDYNIRADAYHMQDGYIYMEEGDMYIGTGVGKIVLAPETYAEYDGYEIANKNDLPKKNVIATFNTNSFVTQADGTKRLVIIGIQNYISNSDLLVITWGGCFAICPIPVSGPGRVCAALWNANGESEITRIRYELNQLEGGIALTITIPGNFQLPSNFTGYVINYKIA